MQLHSIPLNLRELDLNEKDLQDFELDLLLDFLLNPLCQLEALRSVHRSQICALVHFPSHLVQTDMFLWLL